MKRSGSGRRIVQGAAAMAIAAACALGCAGCVGYSTYPPSEGGGIGGDSPNAPHMADAMLVALGVVLDRYPPEGEFVINFPEGMWPRKVAYVMERLNNPDARTVNQAADRAPYLPVYHVSRVMVRLGRAEVDIHRPVLALSAPGQEQVYQVVTVYLDGGRQRWSVDRSRSWTIGAIPAPPLHRVGGDEAPAEAGADEPGAGADAGAEADGADAP